MSTLPLQEGSSVETEIGYAMVVRYLTVAALTLAVYECIITIKEEAELIWSSRVSLPKALFYANRSLPMFATVLTTYGIVSDTDYNNCKTVVVISSLLLFLCYSCAATTLSLRAYAVWGRSRTVLILLVIVVLSSGISSCYLAVSSGLSSSTFPIHPFHSGCIVLFSDKKQWVAYLILVSEATVVFGLLLARGFSYYYGSGSLGTVLKTVLTGGAMYFLCIICMAFANLLLLLYEEGPISFIFTFMQGVLCCALSNRLLLHLRQVDRQQVTPDVSALTEAINFRSIPTLTVSTFAYDESNYSSPQEQSNQTRSL